MCFFKIIIIIIAVDIIINMIIIIIIIITIIIITVADISATVVSGLVSLNGAYSKDNRPDRVQRVLGHNPLKLRRVQMIPSNDLPPLHTTVGLCRE